MKTQEQRRDKGESALPSPEVITRLLAAGQDRGKAERLMLDGAHGRPAVTIQSSNRHGVALRLHAGHGLSNVDLMNRLRDALMLLEDERRGLQR